MTPSSKMIVIVLHMLQELEQLGTMPSS